MIFLEHVMKNGTFDKKEGKGLRKKWALFLTLLSSFN
jgi:hypothetical protein